MTSPNPAPRLVLASTSPYRRQLLERLGLPFEVRSPGVDEAAHRDLAPDAQATRLAELKAQAVAAPGALVIGSDQLVDLDGEVLGKPGSAEAAVAQLRRMAGRTHRLVTAVAVHDVDAGRTRTALDVHRLTMLPLPDALLERYVALDAPLDCAGAYRLEGRGLALFSRIEADPDTADDTAIIGLPLMKLIGLLRAFGVEPLA